MERDSDLWLGSGWHRRGEDQQEPRGWSNAANGDDRKIFGGRRPLLGSQHRLWQGLDDQRGENPDGGEAGHQAVERCQVQPTFPGKLSTTSWASNSLTNRSLDTHPHSTTHPSRDGTFP